MIDRAFTKAEARYIPNGPGSTADMAHPTRTGDLVVFAYPPYQFDAETPGTLVAPSHFFGQHGYVPDVQNLGRERQHAGDVPRRRRRRSPRARSTASDDRPRADARLPARHPRAAAEPGQGAARRRSRAAARYKPISIIGLNDFHGQLDPTTLTFDGTHHARSAARRSLRRCSTRSWRRCPARRCSSPPATTSAPRRRTRRCCRTCRRSTSRTRGAWTRRRTATTSSTTASRGCSQHQARAHFPFLATNIVDDRDRPGAAVGHALDGVHGQRRARSA